MPIKKYYGIPPFRGACIQIKNSSIGILILYMVIWIIEEWMYDGKGIFLVFYGFWMDIADSVLSAFYT